MIYLEVREHLETLGIIDLKTISKRVWKKKVKKYIMDLIKTNLLKKAKSIRN